jgi:hypothetical protein
MAHIPWRESFSASGHLYGATFGGGYGQGLQGDGVVFEVVP